MEVGLGSDNSHLFHDSKYGDACSKLDVKEQMETRERNKREERAFEYKSKILERATQVTRKSMDHEARVLRESLRDIQAKTPYFEDIIKPSRSSMYAALSSTSPRGISPLLRQIRKSKDPFSSSGHSKSLPSILDFDELGDNLANSSRQRIGESVNVVSRRHPELRSQPHVTSSPSKSPRRHTVHETSTTDSELAGEEELQDLKSSTKNYIRKSRYISNSLGNIYRHRTEQLQQPKTTDSKQAITNGYPSSTLVRAHFILQSYRAVGLEADEDKSISSRASRDTANLSLQARGLEELSLPPSNG